MSSAGATVGTTSNARAEGESHCCSTANETTASADFVISTGEFDERDGVMRDMITQSNRFNEMGDVEFCCVNDCSTGDKVGDGGYEQRKLQY